MTCLRLFIDDVPACLTQRAVLADFATTLAAGFQGHASPAAPEGREASEPRLAVVWASALQELPSWPDAPPESSRRLAVRLAALAPLADTVTAFLPAHTLPGPIALPPAGGWRQAPALATDGARAVADLDLFVVDNASAEVAALHAHLLAHPGYEAASRYQFPATGPLPAWLVEGGLSSARLLTHRPWYSAHAPRRGPWLRAVAQALDAGRLTLAQVADDARRDQARPSLYEEVVALRGDPLPAGGADLTLDALFVPPECRLPPAQQSLLRSRELQRRTLAHARRNGERKATRQRPRAGGLVSLARPLLRSARQAWRTAWRAGWRAGRRILYAAYVASLRPLVHRLRATGAAEP